MRHMYSPIVALYLFLSFVTQAKSDVTTPLRIANIIIPASFAIALEDGLSVPLYLNYIDQQNKISNSSTDEPIGNAILQLKNGSIHLLRVEFNENKKINLLNDNLTNMLSKHEVRVFSENGVFEVDKNANMQLDLVAMLLTVNVAREAFRKSEHSNDRISLIPSVDSLTGVHRYNMGYSFSQNNSGHSDSNFLQISNTLGYGAHHLVIDSSLYNVGESQSYGDIYRTMYVRDLEARRVAAGMVSTWDLQTLGVVTALNTGRIYGISYGNQTQSSKNDISESVTPIQVFMPANGEVKVYRENRLIAIQNLSMGNQRIDTTSFPNGVYNVKVEIYVDGYLTETSTQRVTKLMGNMNFAHEWGWQWWGGLMEGADNSQDSHLIGLSLAKTFGSIDFATTGYTFADATVGEARINWQVTDKANLSFQTMMSSDSTWRFASNQSIQLHDNISLWASQEKLLGGDSLTISDTELYSTGLSINIGGWVPSLGQLTFNISRDRISRHDRTYIDYYQHLYSGRYGNLSLRASVQNSSSSDEGFNNKSLMLDYSIPFDSILSFGMSSNEKGQATANVNFQKKMDGVINQASLNASKMIQGGDEHSIGISGMLGFDNQTMAGTMTLSRGHGGELHGNIISRGSLITTNEDFISSSQNETNSGVIINTGITKDGQMLAKINGEDYPLKGQQTFLGLRPFHEYEIELLNSKNSKDSYYINSGKINYTLFPGSVATLNLSNEIKEMITVFGVIRAEDGKVLSNARLDNHIGSTVTNELGEFALDVDKKHPALTFQNDSGFCEAKLDLADESGAVWVGDIICRGLPTYATANGY